MKLCMFHPNDNPMERGWVGKLDGERVVHLAALTLQAFFLGGGGAREHAEYALDEVTLLVPVLYPPAVRVFAADGDGAERFRFANPTSVFGPGATIHPPPLGELVLSPRLAAIVGAAGAIGGFSVYAQFVAVDGPPPQKDSDFGSVLGPVVVTPDEVAGASLETVVRVGDERFGPMSVQVEDWPAMLELAGAGTVLRPGDVLVGHSDAGVRVGDEPAGVEVATEGIGSLAFGVGEPY
jgi:hypothetical protein